MIPSLERAGLQVPAGLKLVPLCAILGATVALLFAAIQAKLPVDRLRLLFLVYPIAYFAISVVKVDFDAIFVSIVAVAIVLSISFSLSEETLRIYRRGTAALIVISVGLAAFDDRFAIVDRDFLPVIVDGRAFGLMGHPNTLGLLSGLLLVGTLSATNRSAYFVIAGVGLLAAASQTSILATLLAGAAYLAVRILNRMGAVSATIFVSMSLAVGVAVMMFTDVAGILTSESDNFDGTLTGRTEIWATLLRQDYGLLGLSSDDFTYLLETEFSLGSAHNLYVEALLRSGIVGLAFVGVFLVLLVVSALRTRAGAPIAIFVFLVVSTITEGVLLSLPLIAFLAAFTSAPRTTAAASTGGERQTMRVRFT
ncbi:O-antigen ligase family protein [Microbacterium sp. Re1]|uniref:O-antigen ligase family protein n=1 Tax=Microbacterium commune TaxID=2762219 RepID=A0ABR8W2R5_9MICO|nr:O-antigen ligase family protein [Microbacterium commune]MBD8011307.1 O-antigen ligase family protein [Microbacterium commune]